MSEYDLYHIDDKGRRVDLSDKQEELAEGAIERSADKMDEYVAMAEEEYMDIIYPRDHDEYLVDGAILECNQAIGDDCGYDDRGFAMQSPGKTTVLNVTGESYAKACGYLYHATVKDRELGVNIKPFPCNCRIGANTPEEKAKVAEDELCQTEGNCRALINLNDDWDNLPSRESYFLYWNEENRQFFSGITMSSILFCKHGGIITAKTSGQRTLVSEVFAVACATTGGPKGGLTTAQEEANAQYIYNFFKAQGWTTEAICGLLGNMQRECGLNPGNWQHWERKNLGYGLLQWTPAEDYLTFMDMTLGAEINEMAKNNPQELMDSQLDFIMKSLDNEKNGVACRWAAKPASSQYYKLPFYGEISPEMTVEEYTQSTCDHRDLAREFQEALDEKNHVYSRMHFHAFFYGVYHDEICR